MPCRTTIQCKKDDENCFNEYDVQPEKHSKARVSTFCGITIDYNGEHENSEDSMLLNLHR
jgi:hypothetical protein